MASSVFLFCIMNILYSIILFVLQHGRVKVRTVAEQAEAKKKEKEKKLQAYNAALEKIFEKVSDKEH